MILDPVMKLEIELGMEVGSLEAGSRKAYRYRRWPNPKAGVPYTIDRTLGECYMAKITPLLPDNFTTASLGPL